MMNIDLKTTSGIGYKDAEAVARKAIENVGGNVSLFAWYDKAREMGTPREACSLESWKCVRDYAEHHNADYRVAVNGDEYEFYFSRIPSDAEELDREGIEESHRGISSDEFENVQGG